MSQSQRIKVVLFILCGVFAVGIIGLNIPECDDQVGLITNTLTNCSYGYIYCNGSDSQYCVDTGNCSETYFCNATTTTTIATTTATPTTPAANVSTTSSTNNNSTLSSAEVRQRCQSGVTGKYPYPNNSNYYYNCINGYLLVEQCPFCYSFNTDNGTCTGLMANCSFN
ncbi:chondroitin proteoglycan 1 [Drosophila tropicalis]|uniref:chondroitin proteoglycan 1 n=1 Tax=Drosophila tropicalis TaxID=46794 RepID=UPI0035AB838B